MEPANRIVVTARPSAALRFRHRPPVPIDYSETIPYDFGSYPGDGVGPVGGLIADKNGALYGTTAGGGSASAGECIPSILSSCGTVFKLTPSGPGYVESVLWNFQGCPGDGAGPVATLLMDRSGALYGTTQYGGYCTASFNGYGTVFKLSPAGSGYTETILHTFQGPPDGANPRGGVVADESEALYGTSYGGGAEGNGTVFKLTPSASGYTESVLAQTPCCPNYGNLLLRNDGSLYGNASGAAAPGSVFELRRIRKVYKLRVLYNFLGSPTDGYAPMGSLIADKAGSLYGTTYYGGNCTLGGFGCGTAFKLAHAGSKYTESTLYSFQGSTFNGAPNDGSDPTAGLTMGKHGVLFGTTTSGGSAWQQCGDPGGCGTVFKLTPSPSGYTESVLHIFIGDAGSSYDGIFPYAPVLINKSGALFGTTAGGGGSTNGCNCGTVFKLTP